MADAIEQDFDEELDEVAENQDDGQQVKEAEKAAGAKPDFSDELKNALSELNGTVKTLAAKPKEAEVQVTEEEKQKFWKVFNPEATRKDFFKKWFKLNPDATDEEVAEAKGMWSEVQQGLVTQSLRGSQVMMERLREEMEQKYAPLLEYVSSAKAEALRGRFFKTYPALEDTKYNKIVSICAKSLEGSDYKDETSFFKALAENVAEVVGTSGATIDLSKATTTTKTTSPTPRLPRTSVGGTGGSGGKGAVAALKGSDDLEDFLKDDE